MKSITCQDCGRPFTTVGTHACRCPRCAHAHRLAYDRQRRANRTTPRKIKPRTEEQSQRRKEQRRAARILPNARASLAKINAALDELEGALVEEQRRAMHRAWRMNNRRALVQDLWRRSQRKRRRVIGRHDRTPDAIAGLWLMVCREFGFRCAYCGMTCHEARAEGFDLQVDHLVPVTDPGCVHGLANAVPACIHCNASKGNRDLIEWAAAKGLTPAPLAVAKYHRMRGIYAA